MNIRSVLIGLDGATFTVLEPLMDRGVMPFLREFVSRGVRARLNSVIPPLTPPAWTSLVTGKRPGQHGVFDFFRKEAPDSNYVRFATSQDIGSATIWSLASHHGQSLIALNFPLMFPPPAVNGRVVPGGWMPWRQLRLGCYPPGLFDRLKTLPSFDARELALDMTLEEKAIEGCNAEEYADWIALHIRREQRWFEILHHLLREEPADLVGLLFDGVDKLQHLCWRFIDPACRPASPAPWEAEIIGLCETYFRQLDELIARIVDLAGPDANVVLASDHGAGPSTDVFYLNTWLEQEGYLAWAEPAEPVQAPKLGLGQIARHVYQLDWERTTAYAATPSSNGIHLVERTVDDGSRLSGGSTARVRTELADALRQLRHPATGQPVVTEVWQREEVFAGPYQAFAPDLTLTLADGGFVSILRADSPLRPRLETVGTHRPDGIFIASGPGIRAGVELPQLSILDVAPLLLSRLGIPVPADMAGRIPVEVLEPGEAERALARGPATHASPQPAQATAPETGFDEEAEATMLKRLRSLGYVE